MDRSGEDAEAEARAPADEPVVAPWTPDPDPWRMEPDAPTWTEPSAETAAAFDEAPSAEAPPVDAGPAEPAVEAAEPAPPPAVRWPARSQELPDWIAEPLPTGAEDQGGAGAEDQVGADASEERSERDAEPSAASGAAVALPDAELADEAEVAGDRSSELEPRPAAGDAAEEGSGSFWDSILPWRGRDSSPEADAASTSDPAEPAGTAEPAEPAEPVGAAAAAAASPTEDEEEAGVEPAGDHGPSWLEVDSVDDTQPPAAADDAPPATFEPRWPSTVPEAWSGDADAAPAEERDDDRPAEAEADAEGDADVDAPAAFVPIGGGLTYATPDPESSAVAEAADEADEAAPDAWSRPSWQADDEAARASEAERADPWAPRSDWDEDGGESTRVLPTDWSPPPPAPVAQSTLEPSAGPVRTTLAEPDVDELDEELAAPTIAEQAVPWLIGVILLLAGMVIVLLALIFAGDGSLGGSASSPTPSPTLLGVPITDPTESPSPTPSAEPTATVEPSATPEATPSSDPIPQYGPLEMVYQGRSAALAPIYLLRRDFTVEDDPAVLAQDSAIDVRRFAWAPDGRVGAGLLADVLVSIEPGEEKRRLGDGLSTITFGDDASTVYAVRITEDGTDDTATVLSIDFASGDTTELASVTYQRPQVGQEADLAEAGFSDDGGAVRLFWMNDDTLRLWVLGGGAWTITPADGEVTELDGEPLPTLVAPNGRERIDVEVDDGTSTLTRLDMNERPLASVSVEGIASHVRWSPDGDRVVFTLGRSAPGGGILQDLFLWDLGNGDEPMQLTATGAAFGAEWLGTQPRWRE